MTSVTYLKPYSSVSYDNLRQINVCCKEPENDVQSTNCY